MQPFTSLPEGSPPIQPASRNVDNAKRDVQREYQPEAQLQIGVSFSNLACYGFNRSDQFQLTFLDYLLLIPRFIVGLLRQLKRQRSRIIFDFEGIIQPGEMLLVLGRPGSGCSTFLKALAGDTRGFTIGDSDGINYQGISYSQFHDRFKGERVYLAELDVHFPELTLGETLNFAASTRQQNNKELGLVIASKFGLTEAFDTQVGDAIIRGISGGEKRRTSIAEAFIAGSQFQCWDNSTRGLDSSTANRFIKLLRETTYQRYSTVAMSLYQASDNMYQNFDLVTLLYEGRQIYFGPSAQAVDYFVRLGFIKPSRDSVADFLTSLTNPKQRRVKEGYEYKVPRSPEEFANVWKQSDEAKGIHAKIRAFNSVHPITKTQTTGTHDDGSLTEKLRLRTSTYPIPLYRQAFVCIHRAYRRICRNIAADISAAIANTILGLIVGSVFYNLPGTSDTLQPRAVLIFFSLMINAFAPAFEVVVMWAQRPIVEKHHRYAFYHPSTERLASLVCDLPTKVLVCLGIHIPIYFLSNLRRTASAFIVYWFFMFVNLITMSLLFRVIGSVSKTREQTSTPVSIIILLCIIYTGYIIPPKYMVPWLGWFWRINPLAYTYESLMINEMNDRQFPCSVLAPSGPSYSQIGIDEKVCVEVGSEPGRQFIEGSDYLALKYGYVPSHIWRNLGILFAMMIAFLAIHLLAAQYIPAQPSRGEVLLFRRGKRTKKNEARDPETGTHSISLADIQPEGRIEDSSHLSFEISGSVSRVAHSVGFFHWTNLRYEIKGRTILQNVDGWVKPGTLTSLMGITGAGKTSLLNVLANRTTTGKVTGEVFVDGHIRDLGFQRKVGYVQQDDIHLATTTVREALQFSALMRQSESITRAEKLAYVESVLDMMDMREYAEAIVGVPGEGLNVEQRKRLTIAVEMVAKPDLLLFLDEPTSGLDSQTAWSICSLLRRLADNGQTILCTIHQPSYQLFRMFDRLLLLGEGGTTLYFGDIGDDASNLIDYFESNGAPRCPPGNNPAEWMLEVTGKDSSRRTDHDAQTGDWADTWQSSTQKREVLHQLTKLQPDLNQRELPQPSRSDSKYAVSLLFQMTSVTKRIFQDQWRDPVYLYSKITLSIGLTLFNGISFYNASLDIQGVTSLLFSIFLITSLFSSITQLVVPHVSNRRDLFEARERNSNTYSWIVFIAASVVVELCWQTLISVPSFVVWYYPIGLEHYGTTTFDSTERGAVSFLLVWLFTLWASTLSQAFAVAIQHGEIAMQLAILFYWLTLVFCGVLVSPSSLPGFWIFMNRVSPLTYLLEGLAVAGVGDAKISCSAIETLNIPIPSGQDGATCGEYLAPFANSTGGYVVNPGATSDCMYCIYTGVNSILKGFGMDTRHAWRNVGIMASYVVFNIGLIFAGFWLLRVPKRHRAGI
ncbi:ABC-2 type transporter-domain-containing protein [Xylaria cf. heliscus]|nr:ABC-2 type transporter-domain-containing protein [Xylaria cf. heliscus]